MLGNYQVYSRSMNGVITISDGQGSFITDGQAIHDDVFFTNEIEATQGTTKLTQTEVITTDVICDDLTASTTNITNLTADTVNTDRLIVYDTSNNIVTDLNGTNSTSTFNGVSNFNNTINVTNKNIVQTQTGEINQSGTGTNDFKDSNINGFLVVGSNITQNGGSSSLKDVTCDTLTLRSGKSIIQSGTTSNSLSDTTVSNLIITTSVSFPSSVTIPGTTTNGDIIMLEDSIIDQSLLDEPSGKTNIFRNTKTLDLEVDGDFDMSKGGSSATLKNTTIEGTAEIQGDITQTTGSTVLKTISCNNITLNADQNITQSGTGYITQSGTGFNLMKTIELTTNSNIKFYGTGILDQPYNTSVNVLNNTRVAGYGIVGGKNNSVAGNTQSCINNNGLQLQWNRDASSQYSFLMNNRSSGGNGGFRFQRYSTGNIIDEPLIIDDSITMNKNLSIPGGSLTCASASLGNISQTEINCLDNCSVNIQTELNLLSDEIDNLQSSTSGNTTALTGISYNAGTDTTTVDNNLTVSAGKNLLVGGANVITLIDTNADDIIALNQRTTGISYNAAADRTTIDNNVTINKTLIVQGMDIKAEIDALDATITSGTLNTNDLTANNLTVELDTRLGNNGGHTYFKGPAYFCDIVDGDETQYTDVVQNNNILTIDNSVANSEIVFNVKNATTSIEALRIKPTSIVSSNSLLVEKLLTVENKSYLKDDITVYKNLFLPNGLSLAATNFITGNVNLGYYMEEYNVLQVDGINPVVTLPALIGTNTNYLVVSFVLISKTSTMTIRPQQVPLKKLYDINRNEILSFALTPTTYTSVRLMYYEPNNNWYVLDFQQTPDSFITTTLTATTANITTANVTTLNTTGTSSLNNTNITTTNGQTSGSTLSVGDSSGGVDKSLIIVPNSNPGAYNGIVQTGDISIVGVGDTQNQGRMAISTWSNIKNGVRISNDSTTINGGNNYITADDSWLTLHGQTFVKNGGIRAKNLGAGYCVTGALDAMYFNPIPPCSVRFYRPADDDDYYLINPGYKVETYDGNEYSGLITTYINSTSNNFPVAFRTLPEHRNRVASMKVYYTDSSGDTGWTELQCAYISYSA